MRVLVLSHMYPSVANDSAGIFVHQQLKALRERAVDIQAVAPTPWTPIPIRHLVPKWTALSRIPGQTVWEGVPVVYPRYLAFPRAWFFASSGRRVHRATESLVRRLHDEAPFDLIHAHVALPDGYAGTLLARSLGIPLVVTIHGQDLQHTVNSSTRCRRAVGCAVERASRVIVVSRKLKQLAARHFGCHNKVAVVPNGIDLRDLQVQPADGICCANRGPVVLSVSNLVETKGVDLNLLAVQRLYCEFPKLRYCVIGEGPLEQRLRQKAHSLGLGDCVSFLGRQPHHVVMEHMARADVFALPSWQEGFGVVYLEAMASGKPVIGCQGEGVEDFVEHGRSGLLVNPRDVEDLTEALGSLLRNPQQARTMGEYARKRVKECYTWSSSAESVCRIYDEVMGER